MIICVLPLHLTVEQHSQMATSSVCFALGFIIPLALLPHVSPWAFTAISPAANFLDMWLVGLHRALTPISLPLQLPH